jgi:hypothetical protein
VPTPRDVSKSCFVCGNYRTYRWTSSNVCYSCHVATGSVTFHNEVRSTYSTTQGVGVNLSGSKVSSGNYLLLNRCFDPFLLLITALARNIILLWSSSLAHVLPFWLTNIPISVCSSSPVNFLQFTPSDFLSNLAFSLCFSYSGASRAATFALAGFLVLGLCLPLQPFVCLSP